ncbi:hypothetical protein KIW84_013805 [Lathyrus oleraceus]|uniref:DNA ligase n=1 Tax=Pisum sativum TaxID=3888 RepID=A0A9D5BLH1_PEA|nr:hypothetical protein KIW84_013805 [Pisum sativum]
MKPKIFQQAESKKSLISDGGKVSILPRRTIITQDHLHKFKNFLSQPATQSSVVGPSCATTTSVHSSSAPMLNSLTGSSHSHPNSASNLVAKCCGNLNPRPITHGVIKSENTSLKETNRISTDQATTAVQACSSLTDAELTFKENNPPKELQGSVAKESGKDSQEKKKNHIKSLLVAAFDCEPLCIIRLLQSKLRIGYAEQTLLAALGHAAVYSEEHSKPPPGIQSLRMVYGNFQRSVILLLVFLLGLCCQKQPKIHYLENGTVEIYSRNAERNTGKFPDVVAAVSRLKKTTVSSFILDCELVAYDRAKQRILPFQVLSTRARKNVSVSDIKVEVCIFAFDLLYLNGQALLQEKPENP